MNLPTYLSALLFFNPIEAGVVEAIAARIIPGSEQDPGAQQAGVVHYVDQALAGFHRELQTFYREGVARFERRCRGRFARGFTELSAEEQDSLLAEIDEEYAGRGNPTPDAMFFAVVREHAIQGMFSDPAYGGNRGYVGWKLVGFPGAQWGYTAEQMEPGFDTTTIRPMSLGELRESRATMGYRP